MYAYKLVIFSILDDLFQFFLGDRYHLTPGHTLCDDTSDGTTHVHVVHFFWLGLLNWMYPAID